MSNGLQTFLRMANLFGPQEDDTNAYMGMPPELPTRGMQPELINRRGPSISVPGAYEGEEEEPTFGQRASGQPSSILDAFRQNVLNPPQRTQMTYPKNTLAGLTEALKIAAEPSPLEKNRVYVNGQAYQKQQVRTDPVTGEKQFITNVKEPSFMSQVMRAMPAAVSPAVDILNQPREDAVADWEMQNKAMGQAIGAESQMALAGQRQAQAGAIPQRVQQGERALDIKQMDADTRARVAALKDLPDSEKLKLLQEGKINLQELNAAAQMARLERGGEIRSGQIEQQGNIRSGQIAQQGNIRSGQIAQQGAIRSGQIEQQGGIAKDVARVRGEEARKTKGTAPGGAGATSQLPTQQKVAMQNRAQQVINQNPEWGDYITISSEGFPEIEAPGWLSGPDKDTYDKMYEAIYGTGRAAPINPPSTKIPSPPAGSVPMTGGNNKVNQTPIGGTTKAAPPKQQTGGAVEMVTPDGKGTRMVPANMVQMATQQGYKPKGSK